MKAKKAAEKKKLLKKNVIAFIKWSGKTVAGALVSAAVRIAAVALCALL